MVPDHWDVTVRDTTGPDDMLAAVREAVERGYDAILACGGDGTLNVVLNGVAEALEERGAGEDRRLAIGLIPGGTGNVWAREAGIPRELEDAVAMLVHGERRQADLGCARIGDRPPRRFLLMCGIGLDARVVAEVERHPRAKQRAGRAAFVLPALTAIGRSHPVETIIEVDGISTTVPLRQAVAGNSRLYGGVLRLAGDARIDDGMLDLVSFTAPGGPLGTVRAMGLALRAARGNLAKTTVDGITYQRGHAITLRPATSMPVQVDGEYLGEAGPDAPITLTVQRAAVTMIVGEPARVLFS